MVSLETLLPFQVFIYLLRWVDLTKVFTGLGDLLAGVDKSLNQVLNGLSNLLAGVLKLVANLYVVLLNYERVTD